MMIDVNSVNSGNGRILGVVVGIVTNNRDPEGIGRVKVRFPWRSDESYWARIATLMAGKEKGTFFLPEVGDEVLVAFEHGDIHHPYVIGVLWNGKDTPPETNADGRNSIKKIKLKSGHEVIFSDESGKEKIEIKSKSGHRIVLDDSVGSERIEVKDKAGNSIIIDSVQNSIAISSRAKISIEAQMIEIKANATLILQGGLVKIN
ncbi:phage tail protein [Archaeoglobales archaeon]|nr:MAG: phage tail protein [Archaeoglobales archaeon]